MYKIITNKNELSSRGQKKYYSNTLNMQTQSSSNRTDSNVDSAPMSLPKVRSVQGRRRQTSVQPEHPRSATIISRVAARVVNSVNKIREKSKITKITKKRPSKGQRKVLKKLYAATKKRTTKNEKNEKNNKKNKKNKNKKNSSKRTEKLFERSLPIGITKPRKSRKRSIKRDTLIFYGRQTCHIYEILVSMENSPSVSVVDRSGDFTPKHTQKFTIYSKNSKSNMIKRIIQKAIGEPDDTEKSSVQVLSKGFKGPTKELSLEISRVSNFIDFFVLTQGKPNESRLKVKNVDGYYIAGDLEQMLLVMDGCNASREYAARFGLHKVSPNDSRRTTPYQTVYGVERDVSDGIWVTNNDIDECPLIYHEFQPIRRSFPLGHFRSGEPTPDTDTDQTSICPYFRTYGIRQQLVRDIHEVNDERTNQTLQLPNVRVSAPMVFPHHQPEWSDYNENEFGIEPVRKSMKRLRLTIQYRPVLRRKRLISDKPIHTKLSINSDIYTIY